MRTVLRVAAAFVVLGGCHRDVRDPRVGTIEFVLEPVCGHAAMMERPEIVAARWLRFVGGTDGARRAEVNPPG